MLGFKSEAGGLSRAKVGVMRRLSMVALRSTARATCCGGHHDAFGNDRGATWRNPTDGGG